MPELLDTLGALLRGLTAGSLCLSALVVTHAVAAHLGWRLRGILSTAEKAALGTARRERDEAETARDAARAEVASLRHLLRDLMAPAPVHHDRREVRHGAR